MDNQAESPQLAPKVAELFPPGVIAAGMYGSASPHWLFPEEMVFVRAAVPKRQSEFTAGRVCARRALATLGFSEGLLLPTQHRVPQWPDGVVGSISHADQYCVAVVALSSSFSGIGVDTECLGRVEPTIWDEAFRPEEIARLRTLSGSQQNQVATTMFSAKEAFYKCQFATTGTWLDFHDVSIETEKDRFNVLVHSRTVGDLLDGRSLEGKFSVDDTRVICGIAIRNPRFLERDMMAPEFHPRPTILL